METRKPLQEPKSHARVSDFVDLESWRFGRQLRVALYQLTNDFPADEKYGLSAQIRRAAVSVTANIAEGYGRYSYQENVQFCRVSRGSLYELRDHLITALDSGYLSIKKFEELNQLAMSAIRLVNGYIRATKNLQASNTKAKLNGPV